MVIHSIDNLKQLQKIDCLVYFIDNSFETTKLQNELNLSDYDNKSLQEVIKQKQKSPLKFESLFLPLPLTNYGSIYLISLELIKPNINELRQLWGIKIATLKKEGLQKIAFFGLDDKQNLALAEVTTLATYEFKNYKTDPIKSSPMELTLCVKTNSQEIKKIQAQCSAANWARDLVNTPAKDLTPTHLANIAQKLAETHRLDYTIFNEKEIARLGMGALHAVSLGSPEEAKFIILKYKNTQATKHIALVGKGVTFDSGGLSLKPSNFMIPMKTDMGGAATVLGAFRSLVELKPAINITCVIPTTENMIDGKSIKLGDVIIAYNGKSIEIHNSDAEGRLILADALAYTEDKIKPDTIIDIATLTGAVKVCLGHQHAGLITQDDILAQQLKDAGEQVNELLWQLPLTNYHQSLMKGKIADLCNIASKPVAGTSTAAAFLENFIDKTSWAHLDIAGVARECQASYLSHHGATGFGVRLLSQYVLNLAK